MLFLGRLFSGLLISAFFFSSVFYPSLLPYPPKDRRTKLPSSVSFSFYLPRLKQRIGFSLCAAVSVSFLGCALLSCTWMLGLPRLLLRGATAGKQALHLLFLPSLPVYSMDFTQEPCIVLSCGLYLLFFPISRIVH